MDKNTLLARIEQLDPNTAAIIGAKMIVCALTDPTFFNDDARTSAWLDEELSKCSV